MRGKIVLLYESDQGKALCNAASRVLTQVAVTFGHPLTVPLRCCDQAEISDELLDLCADADAVLAGESGMAALPALARELLCVCRVRELRYTHLIENRALMGQPLHSLLIQALDSSPEALQAAASLAYKLSARENLPIAQVPPTGKLAEGWKQAVEQADSLSAPFHARELALAQVIPDIVYRPARIGILLCPPYAGGILADAAAALCGAPSMDYDEYTGGQCPVFAPLCLEKEAVSPFGMLRAVHRLLRDKLGLEQEAACVEAAIRNVLQAGWRTPEIARPGAQMTDGTGIADLICQQIEVAGEWIHNS